VLRSLGIFTDPLCGGGGKKAIEGQGGVGSRAKDRKEANPSCKLEGSQQPPRFQIQLIKKGSGGKRGEGAGWGGFKLGYCFHGGSIWGGRVGREKGKALMWKPTKR